MKYELEGVDLDGASILCCLILAFCVCWSPFACSFLYPLYLLVINYSNEYA